MISFKDLRTIDEWADLDSTARDILGWVYAHWPLKPDGTSKDIIVTRIQGPPIPGESGVHQQSPHRAWDFSIHTITLDEAHSIESETNAQFEYDFTRPEKNVCLLHDAGAGGLHLHFQTHPRTRIRPSPPVTA